MPQALATLKYGDPSNYALIGISSRAPEAHEVVVAVEASGINPVDLKIAEGSRSQDPAALPLRLGYEAAGVISAVGAEGLAGADGVALAVGQAVIAYRVQGGHASELTIPATAVLQRPLTLPVEVAAGLLLVATTAFDALETVRLTSRETVLVHGAGGSVGQAAVQLAMLRGASVVATAAPERHGRLRQLGATPVAYGSGLLERVRTAAPHVDAVVDAVGTEEAGLVSVKVVKDARRLVTVTGQGAIMAAGGSRITGVDPRSIVIRDAARAEMVRLAASGHLDLPVVASYPVHLARRAFELVGAGHAGGKVVIRWSEPAPHPEQAA